MSEPLNDAPTTEKALETLDVLSQVEPEVEETEEVKLVEEETESEPEIELETEEETEKPDEEELELTTPVRRRKSYRSIQICSRTFLISKRHTIGSNSILRFFHH